LHKLEIIILERVDFSFLIFYINIIQKGVFMKTKYQKGSTELLTVVCVLFAAMMVAGGLYGCPKWNVYRQTMSGESELKKAESTRKIKILEAQAEKESAVLKADAEVSRAIGVAKANKIIGQSLHDNEAYLRYLWINNLHEGGNQVIYVPTEANLPILEAGKRKQ
jgi:hypothetical protein